VWVHRGDGSKLEAHAWPMCWVGFDSRSTHAHCIYWPRACSITAERDVRFTADFTTVYTSAPPLKGTRQMAAPPAPITSIQVPPALTPIPLATQVPTLGTAQQSVLQRPTMQLPPATSSSEEEVEVEDKLNKEVVGPLAPKGAQRQRTSIPSGISTAANAAVNQALEAL